MTISLPSAAFFCLAFFLSTSHAQTEIKPLWEVGAGAAFIDFPVYRGADERRSYVLPVPYFAYNGKVLQVNRERVRGLFYRSDNVEVDVSVNGSVPAKSKDSSAREGMPDLDATLEVGPSLNIHLYNSESGKTGVDLRMPLRAVTASNFKHFKQAGWLFQPQLALDFYNINNSGWKLGVVGGVIFANGRYHQYFYNVAPEYATAARPAYTAHGGYSGTQFIVASSKRHKGRWIGGFMKWDNLSGAAFEDSPLVKSRQYFTFGFAVTWVFDKSDKMVEVRLD